MTYGLATRAFIENGPVEQVARLAATRSSARRWRALGDAHRLALIDHALRPANENLDGFPPAL